MYLWRIPDEYPEKFVGIYQRELSPDQFLFSNGNAVTTDISTPRIEFDVPPSRLASFDVLPNSSMIPLVSENVSRLLLKYWKNDVQLIDTQVVAKGQNLDGYRLVKRNQNCKMRGLHSIKLHIYTQHRSCNEIRPAETIPEFHGNTPLGTRS